MPATAEPRAHQTPEMPVPQRCHSIEGLAADPVQPKGRPGRPRVCIGATAERVLWLIRKGDMRIAEAAKAVGISDRAVSREAQRNPTFRQQLTAALQARPTKHVHRSDGAA